MTTLAKLLAQKQWLIERPDENPGPEECEEIERNAALDSLDGAGPGISSGPRKNVRSTTTTALLRSQFFPQ
jgi:hypothetical protein